MRALELPFPPPTAAVRERVLNVNDDPVLRHAIGCTLTRAGFAITEAADSAAALRAHEQDPPDLALLDINMPGMNGLALCAEIRRNPRTASLPVVFLSASIKDDRSKAHGLECGADGYLTWPIDQAVLAASLRSVLRIRQTEAKLRESEERFRSTFEQAAVGLGHLSLAGEWTWVNPRLCEILGYTREELLRQNAFALASPEAPEMLLERQRQLLSGEAERFALEQRCRRKDGSPFWASWTASVARGADGQPQHFVVVIDDISIRKWTEEDLLCIRAGVEGSSEAIAITDSGGRHAYHNRAFTHLFGYRVEELAESSTLTALQADPCMGRVVFDAVMGGHSWRGEVEMVAKGGRRFPVELRADIIRDERGQVIGLIEIVRDITEQKQAESAIRLLNDQLEQRVRCRTAQLEAANKELEAFSYSVSHDLRAPVRHISGYAERLAKTASPALSEKARHFLDQIADSARHMACLIDDLLVFSRMGRAELKQEWLSLDRLVEQARQQLGPETQGRNLRWILNPLPMVLGDRLLLRQALVNLLSNALKYTRRRDPAEIEIGWRRDGTDEVVIFVRDNGVGFDMQYADKLFGVFQRLHSEDAFEGTGIGLVNVRRIIARHGGRTWADGKPDAGATFYFSLPNNKLPSQPAE